MKRLTQKEYAVFKGNYYILVEHNGEKRILDEYGCVVIPDAPNGWTDLLDYIVKEGKNA
jgi:hypothetical protein